ncbi:MAG: NrdH-redoxin [Acidimicrobiales bacterium]
MLKFGLLLRGVKTNKINIWRDPAYAETVRSVANGDETVPTVLIGDHAMVNPTAGQVKQAIAERAPHLL